MFTPCTEPLRPGCHNFSFLLQSRGCSTCGNSLYSQAVCQEQPPRGPLVTTGSFSSSSSVMKSFSNTVEEKSLRQIWASLLHFWVVEEECVCCNAGSQPWVVGWRRRFWSPLVSRREQSAGVEDFFFLTFIFFSAVKFTRSNGSLSHLFYVWTNPKWTMFSQSVYHCWYLAIFTGLQIDSHDS